VTFLELRFYAKFVEYTFTVFVRYENVVRRLKFLGYCFE
jgi:hypothetical protein